MPKKPKSKSKGRDIQRWKNYEIKDGKAKPKNKICPKCASFLAEMKNRRYCGKCRYTEILRR